MQLTNLDEANKKNKDLSTLLYKRYGQVRTLAYNCLLVDYNDRVKSIYTWVRTGKLNSSQMEIFVKDFIIEQKKQYTSNDVDDIIKFIKSL